MQKAETLLYNNQHTNKVSTVLLFAARERLQTNHSLVAESSSSGRSLLGNSVAVNALQCNAFTATEFPNMSCKTRISYNMCVPHVQSCMSLANTMAECM